MFDNGQIRSWRYFGIGAGHIIQLRVPTFFHVDQLKIEECWPTDQHDVSIWFNAKTPGDELIDDQRTTSFAPQVVQVCS